MPRQTIEQKYASYSKKYDEAVSKGKLMREKLGMESFTMMYDIAHERTGGKNVIRQIVNDSQIATYSDIKITLENKFNRKATRKEINEVRNLALSQEMRDKFGNLTWNKYIYGHETGQSFSYTDSHIFFAAMKELGYTEDEAKAMYGY